MYTEDNLHRLAFAWARVYVVQLIDRHEADHDICVNKPQLNIYKWRSVRIPYEKSPKRWSWDWANTRDMAINFVRCGPS